MIDRKLEYVVFLNKYIFQKSVNIVFLKNKYDLIKNPYEYPIPHID